MRKEPHDLTEGLEIDEVWIRQHSVCPNGVIGIEWSGAAGFGRCEFILDDDGVLHANTEYMSDNEDKRFIRKLLELLAEQIVVDS